MNGLRHGWRLLTGLLELSVSFEPAMARPSGTKQYLGSQVAAEVSWL